jgi:two-component sensor histidine kinase
MSGKPLDILVPLSALRLGERRQIVGRRKDGNEFPAEASLSRAEFNGEAVLTVIMRDITQRTLAEERLRASLREKDVLLEEVHHRVKNNLQVISSLLGLQARSIRDAAVRRMFEESRVRIQSMAFLHEILYQSDSLEKIDFADYIRKLAAHLFISHGIGDRISLYLNLDKVYFHKDAVVPCGLILNELLSNIFKYAFPGEQTGEVRIELRGEPGGAARLLVADNGIGMPEGFDWAASRSLGLRLVRTLARQLEAVVEMKSAAGTVFAITFPAAEVAT